MAAPGTPLPRRISRLAGTRSPRTAVRALRREVSLRHASRGFERDLRAGLPVIVGPFAGEVGYELLYWLPFVRRVLRERRVDPGRVVVLSRGGAGAWYRDVAARELDVLDFVTSDALREQLEVRKRVRGDLKQLVPDEFDEKLILAAEDELVMQTAVFHPRFMYARSRFVWEGLEPPSRATELGDYDPLPAIDVPLPDAVAGLEPGSFVAVKVYFNDCLPNDRSSARAVSDLLSRLSKRRPLVVLSTGLQLDDHGEWRGSDGVLELAGALDARTNLAVQTAVVSRAAALVGTYGGFSYLGPYLGVPTLALSAVDEPNRLHEAVLGAAFPDAAYARAAPEAAEDVFEGLLRSASR